MSHAPSRVARASALPALVGLAVFAAFANTIGRYLVWSDFYQIRRAHMIVTARGELQKLWSPDQLRENNYFRPVQVLSESVDAALFGARYEGFHVTQVALHALCAVVVFLLVEQVLLSVDTRAPRTLAAIAAMAWAIEPQRAESVAWLADRGSTLQVFTLLGLYVALRDPVPRRAAIVATALVMLGVLSKEVAVVAPFLFVLLAWVLDAHLERDRRVVAVALFVAMALYLVVRRSFFWATLDLDVHYDLLTRLRTQVVVTADYLAGIPWPWSPSASDVVEVRNRFDARVLADLALLVALLAAAFHRAKKGDRLPLFALLWFFVALAPAANLGLQRHFRGDRYVYLAAIGPIVLVTERLAALVARVRNTAFAKAVAAVVLGALAIATHARNAEWASNDETNEAFFRIELSRAPRFREALGNLCLAASARGDFWKARELCARGLAIDERQWTSTAWQPKAFWGALYDLEWAQHDKNDCSRLLARAAEGRTRWPADAAVNERVRAAEVRCRAR
ncbi:MAG: hypothetical protein ACXVEE_10520 [Polyangiales bacterium]